jgi:hypothetical protein
MSAITVTNAGLNLLRDGTDGANNPKITYVAIGTSSTAPTVTDTKLGAETFRKKISSYANGASVGEILVNGYLNASDAVGTAIAEVGFFGGNTASATPNSGILVAHGLYSHTKLSTEGIQLQLDLTI